MQLYELTRTMPVAWEAQRAFTGMSIVDPNLG
jgi:hypothetical protein